MKTQIRRRGGWLRRAPGVNGSERAKQKQEKRNGAAGAGENWGPLKSENDLSHLPQAPGGAIPSVGGFVFSSVLCASIWSHFD